MKYKMFNNILLLFMIIIGIIISNSRYKSIYENIGNIEITLYLGTNILFCNTLLSNFINDILMTIYFFYIGWEIRIYFSNQTLYTNISNTIISSISALCGIILPAIIYYIFNYKNNLYLQGWAIPTSTDIVFPLIILSLLNNKKTEMIKIILTLIAIFDDIGSMIIINLFYSYNNLVRKFVIISYICGLFLPFMKIWLKKNILFFFIIGIVMWFYTVKSGVNPSICGFILAISLPIYYISQKKINDFIVYINKFLILPIFLLINMNISFTNIHLLQIVKSSLFQGIIVSLLFGKSVGIFFSIYVMKTLRLFKNK